MNSENILVPVFSTKHSVLSVFQYSEKPLGFWSFSRKKAALQVLAQQWIDIHENTSGIFNAKFVLKDRLC